LRFRVFDPCAPDHFRKMLLDDVERFGPVAKKLGLKRD